MDVITDKTLESMEIEEVFFIKCTSSEIIVESVMLIITTISPDTVTVHNGYDFDFKVTVYSPPKYIDCFTEIRVSPWKSGGECVCQTVCITSPKRMGYRRTLSCP